MTKRDEILKEAAMVFTRLGSNSTKKEREEAKREEMRILAKLKDIDPEEYRFYKQCKD